MTTDSQNKRLTLRQRVVDLSTRSETIQEDVFLKLLLLLNSDGVNTVTYEYREKTKLLVSLSCAVCHLWEAPASGNQVEAAGGRAGQAGPPGSPPPVF